jgi:hypothetical protein
MKQLGLSLVVTSIIIVLLVGIIILPALPTQTQQNPIVIPVNPTITWREQELARQQVAYQNEVSALEQALKQTQQTEMTKTEKLQNQVTLAQQQLVELTARQQTLTARVAQLKTIQIERQAGYAQLITQTLLLSETRHAQLQNQLTAVQATLTEIKK